MIKKFVKTISPWLLTLAILYFLFRKVSIAEVSSVIAQLDIWMLMLCLLGSAAAALYAGVEKYREILELFGVQISSRQARIIRMGSLPVKTVLPLMAGEVIRSSYLKNIFSLRRRSGLLNAGVNYLLRFIALGMIVLSAAVFSGSFSSLTGSLLLVLAVFIIAHVKNKYIVSAYRIIAYSLTLELLLLFNVFFIFKALNINISLLNTMLFVPLVSIIGSLHISVAGVGLREGAVMALFAGAALPEKLLAAGVLVSLINGIWPAVLGLIYLKPFSKELISSYRDEGSGRKDFTGMRDPVKYLQKRENNPLFKYKFGRRINKITQLIREWMVKYGTGEKEEIKLLDIGAADGKLLSVLNSKLRLKKAVGIEPCQELIDAGQDSSIEILKGEGENIPFGDSEFDVVVLASVIEHAGDPEKLMSECFRVLRKNGVLIVSAVDPLFDRLAVLSGYKTDDHNRTYTLKELKRLLSQSKFDIITGEKYGMFSIGLLPFEERAEKVLNALGLGFTMFYEIMAGIK